MASSAVNGTNSKRTRFLDHIKFVHLFAGVSGGIISTLALHPLDLIKVRFQVDEKLGRQDRPVYHGIVDAMRAIARQNGVVGLYQGVVTNMCGAGLSWGIYFFLYNALNLHLQDGDSQKKLGVKAHLLTASTASLGALTLSNPIWVTKTRLFLQYEGLKADRKYSGMLDALAKIYRHEGIRGLYKGFLPGIFGISHGALLFVAYEEMKDQWNEYKHQPLDTRLAPEIAASSRRLSDSAHSQTMDFHL